MRGATFVIGFIIYSMGIFGIKNFAVLSVIAIVELLILVFLIKGDWLRAFRFLLKSSGFVVFVMLCNLLFSNLEQALLIGARLELLVTATKIISQLLSINDFAQGIAAICTPLKIFKVDVNEIALCVTIALTFITLLTREARILQNSLKLKGCNFWTFLHYPQVYLVGLVNNLFDMIEAAEVTLRLRGYE